MAHISICQKYANSAVSTYMPSTIREHLLAYIDSNSDVPSCTLTVFAYKIEHVCAVLHANTVGVKNRIFVSQIHMRTMFAKC